MIRKISTQDVVPKRKESETNDVPSRSERDFLIERLTRKHTTGSIANSASKIIKHPPIRHKKEPPTRSRKFKFGNKWIWIGVPLVIVLIIFLVLQFSVSATISITPKHMTVPVDAKLDASINATSSPSALNYQIITLNAEDSEIVAATGGVATKPAKASGQITIFNSYSSASQTLVKNTRFQTADGLIFRTQSTVEVPGQTSSGGKAVPGSVSVTVLADQTGSKYNIDLVDFSIPGFQSDLGRYNKIFGRSKTAMTGGSDGNSFGVSDDARQTAQAAIDARLKDSLLKQSQSQKTANSVIFDSASKISFQHLPDTAGADAQHVLIHEKGTISAVVFDKKMLGKLLLGDAIVAVGSNVEVKGMENLHFIAAVSSTSSVWEAKPFTFTLSGPVDVTGVVDADKLLQDVRGISRGDLTKVLSNYPTVDKATASVRPFWRGSFPSDASKIKIEILK
ncbi:TPA: hypothetical protein DCQ44_02790 [Candidatus Taylorbacteria bacterium]|nr:hypothetical protein [Candidatus Taylorbacteria bacterium]